MATGNGPVALAEGVLDTASSLPDLVVANQSSNTVSVILDNATSPLTSNASAAQTPYPASEYVDLGLKVQAVPRLHPDDEVSLDLQFDIKTLTGQSVNGIPILSNRTVQQSVRLKENQTSVLSGIMQSSDMRSISGLPELSTLGPLGYLAGLHSKQTSDTELLIVVTPRQLRLAKRTDSTIYAGRGTGSVAAAAGPFPGAPAAPGQPGAPAGTPPPAAPPGTPPAATPPGTPPAAPPAAAPPGAPQTGGSPDNSQPGQPPAAAPPGDANPNPQSPPPQPRPEEY